MVNNTDNEYEIDLRELFMVLLRRWWAIVLAIVLGGAAAFGYTYFLVDPLYQASTLLYVNNSDISVGATSFSISNADLTAAQKLVDTYVVILKSRTSLNAISEKAGLNYSYETLRSMVSAKAVNSTEVFEVVVTSKDPAEAEKIANTIADVLPSKIADIVVGSDVRIVDYAVVPSHRSSPSYTRNTATGMLIGAVLMAAILILAYLFDENIRSEDYLTQNYPDIPLLAVIPDMSVSSRRAGYYGYQYGDAPTNTRQAAKQRSRKSDGTSTRKASEQEVKENGK